MNEYGYHWNGMMPLDKEEAKELYSKNKCIYKLYSDNTEDNVQDETDFETHEGLFGIEKKRYKMIQNSFIQILLIGLMSGIAFGFALYFFVIIPSNHQK